jgi:hypothetical protein
MNLFAVDTSVAHSLRPCLQLWGPRGNQIFEGPISKKMLGYANSSIFLFIIITKYEVYTLNFCHFR